MFFYVKYYVEYCNRKINCNIKYKIMKKQTFKKLSVKGIYTYVGFCITQQAITEKKGEEIIEQKAVMSLFFLSKNGETYFLDNNEILDHSIEKPYGIFQQFFSMFNSQFNVELNENFDYVINVDI